MYTIDERLILSLYELTKHEEDSSADRYEVGRRAGLSVRTTDALCQQLIRGNFIRKESEETIYLTELGINLAKSLLEEKK